MKEGEKENILEKISEEEKGKRKILRILWEKILQDKILKKEKSLICR